MSQDDTVKMISGTELAAYLETPEGKQELMKHERNYRRAYWQGYSDAHDAFRSKATDNDFLEFLDGELWRWRHGNCDDVIFPPVIKIGGGNG